MMNYNGTTKPEEHVVENDGIRYSVLEVREIKTRLRYLEDILAGEESGEDETLEEVNALETIRTSYPELWENDGFLISSETFVSYAESLASEMNIIPDTWPFGSIDWNHAAEELRHDYREEDLYGKTYMVEAE